MPTIIDSLVVELGIDGRSMSTGTRKAQQDYKKLRDDATKTGKDLSEAGKRGSEFFVKMRNEALAFFAVFTAGKGLRAFVSDTVASNVALGNLSRNLNTGARTLDAWQRTAKSFGASGNAASGLYQSIQSMAQTFGGRLELNRVASLTGVSFTDKLGHLRGMNDILKQLNQTAQGMDTGRFQAIIGLLGGGQDAATVLEQRNLQQRLQQMTKYAATPQDVSASQELLSDWVRLTSQSEQLGRSFLTHLEPGIHATLKGLSDWIDKHPEFQRMLDRDADAIGRFIAGLNWDALLKDVDAFEKKVEGIDWKTVVDQVKGVRTEVDNVVEALGGWKDVTEAIFALWIGSRFLGTLASLRAVAGLLGSGPLAALLTTASTLATALAAPAIGAAVGLEAGKAPIARNEGVAGAPGPADVEAAVRAEATRQGQDPDLAVAVMRQESGGHQTDAKGRTTTSGAGALGLFQLMPATARGLGVDPNDASQNIRGGVAYLKQLLAQTHGNVDQVLALYNAGGKHAAAFLRTGDYSTLPAETQAYIAGIDANLGKLKHPGRAMTRSEHETAGYAALRKFGHELRTLGDRAGKGLHDAVVHRGRSLDFQKAFEGTDSPTVYSNALLSVAAHPAGGNTTHTTTVHQLTVNTKATDPQGVARAVKAALSSPQRMAAVGNTGLQ